MGSHFDLTPGMKLQSQALHEIKRINQRSGRGLVIFLIIWGLHSSRKQPGSLL